MTIADQTLNQHAARRTNVHGIADTAKLTPEAWHNVGASGEPGFQNSWGNVGGAFAPVRFRKLYQDQVQLDGYATGGATSTVVFTLPSGYRPTYARVVTVQVGNGGLGYVYVQANGTVTVAAVTGNIANGMFLDEVIVTLT